MLNISTHIESDSQNDDNDDNDDNDLCINIPSEKINESEPETTLETNKKGQVYISTTTKAINKTLAKANGDNKIYKMDCCEYLDTIKRNTIDTVILDPPYFNVVNEKWDKQWKSLKDYLKWMKTIIKKISKCAKYSCSLWIFGYAYQLSFIIPIVEKYNFTYRQHIVLDKGLRSVAGRTSKKLKMFPTATEYIVYFHKEARPYIKNFLQEKQAEKKIKSNDINKFLGKSTTGGGTWSTLAGKRQKNIQYPTLKDWNKLQELFGEFDIKYHDYVYTFHLETRLTDVWSDINFYDKTYKKYHPTQKPYKLIERLIKCSTNKNDNVLDIFMGSGMTALVSKNMERNFYGCELNETYFTNNLLFNTK